LSAVLSGVALAKTEALAKADFETETAYGDEQSTMNSEQLIIINEPRTMNHELSMNNELRTINNYQ